MGIRDERQALARSLTTVQRFAVRRILGPPIAIPLLAVVDTPHETDAELAEAFRAVLPPREFVEDLAMALEPEQRSRIARIVGYAKKLATG